MTQEALKQALEAAEVGLANLTAYQSAPRGPTIHEYGQAVLALIKVREAKAALAQPPQHYESGWNSALEMAAHQLENNFKRAFGDDTLKSIAVYIKGLKK